MLTTYYNCSVPETVPTHFRFSVQFWSSFQPRFAPRFLVTNCPWLASNYPGRGQSQDKSMSTSRVFAGSLALLAVLCGLLETHARIGTPPAYDQLRPQAPGVLGAATNAPDRTIGAGPVPPAAPRASVAFEVEGTAVGGPAGGTPTVSSKMRVAYQDCRWSITQIFPSSNCRRW
jgi:hypothetical protein